MMESPDYSPPHSDASRPSLGFPLGTALLLIIIFSLSGIFSCCYHWDKLRSFRRSFADASADLEADSDQDTSKAKLAHTVINFTLFRFSSLLNFHQKKKEKWATLINYDPLFFLFMQSLKQNQGQSLPVLMPGDQVPKFIALPCPCEPPREEKINVVQVEKPPKPPHIAIPLYLQSTQFDVQYVKRILIKNFSFINA